MLHSHNHLHLQLLLACRCARRYCPGRAMPNTKDVHTRRRVLTCLCLGGLCPYQCPYFCPYHALCHWPAWGQGDGGGPAWRQPAAGPWKSPPAPLGPPEFPPPRRLQEWLPLQQVLPRPLLQPFPLLHNSHFAMNDAVVIV